jgi:hypothetical protein
MPRITDKERVRKWNSRTIAADKAYKAWSDKFRCNLLEDYYCGQQWNEQYEEIGEEKYVINMIYSSIETKQPALLYYHPFVKVNAKPTRSDERGSPSTEKARLQQDTVNTFITDKRMGFKDESALALKEAFYRFGVVEVGYTADYIDNPLKQKPELDEDGTDDPLAKLDRIPDLRQAFPENLFVKRIPAKQFRVALNAKNKLIRNDWVGYWEWNYVNDVKQNPNYKNTSRLKSSGKIKGDYAESTDEEERDVDGNIVHKDMIKVWKIWDLRTMKKFVFSDNGNKFFIDGEPFKYLPLAVLKFHERLDEFYPLPMVFNWLHPQNELNETREMQRVHRKRFYRRYLRIEGRIKEDEARKVIDGGDGVMGSATQENAIMPVPDAPLDAAIVRNIPQTKDDFREISGISEEQRGQAGRETTATQANIIEVRSRIKESKEQQLVSEFLADIAWLMLKTIKDNMALPFWIKVNVDPQSEGAMEEVMRVVENWQLITSDQLGDIHYDIDVDIQSLSPVTEQTERTNWTQVLALLTNPALLVLMMTSETILRKTLAMYNIKNEKDIAEIKAAGQQILAMQAAMAQAQSGQGSQTAPGPGPTPSPQDIGAQLQNQLRIAQ